MSKLNILVIVGTTRQGRVGRKIADWYLAEAQKAAPDLNLELFDVADYELPVFDQPVSPMMHQYGNLQNKLAEKIGAADGFVFVTGEYNHSVPGSLKNFIDYLNAEWNYKAAAFVGYGTNGGVRSIEHLIQILSELRVKPLGSSGDHIYINAPWMALDENDKPKPEFTHGNIEGQLKELSWWASALKDARK